ncbi:YfhH family protein [Tuberibacillus sp. Marseille-P3662]|uniref:YfhH family protein n=1 Tax=Tuberibacillus sp. Marseille-P3662 TaxID=1965358 RepID=UPI000A1C9F85|nr:YfhH family protein [Tuberibacillus sp. Marseille-P3662]
MERRYSDMSKHELRLEIAELKEKARKAEQMGMVNDFAVQQRKAQMAEAYLLDPSAFNPGDVCQVVVNPELTAFTISYMNGVFAWGTHQDSDNVVAYPISILKQVR